MKLSKVGFSMVLLASSMLFGALSAQATEVKVGATDVQPTPSGPDLYQNCPPDCK